MSRLDTILGQLADLKTVDVTATVEKEREREGEGGVVSADDKAPATWGSTVAGVSYNEAIKDTINSLYMKNWLPEI